MNKRNLLIPGAAAGALVAALLSLGGGAGATPARTTTAQAAAPSLITPYEARYMSESSGSAAHATLSRVAHDPGLLAAVRSGSTPLQIWILK